ncbi:unnamed protein product [Orchesella dallaii]|uniref:BTB domain-containing protein n=1 Tax=Orchesella dallaii TaxID=48710 RepID=A0ABP1QZT9_9HEXA
MNSNVTRSSMANDSNTKSTISQAEAWNEVNTIWELHNWNRDLEKLKTTACYIINVGSGIQLQLFFEEDVASNPNNSLGRYEVRQRTEYLSLYVRALHVDHVNATIKLRLSVRDLTPAHHIGACEDNTFHSTFHEMNSPAHETGAGVAYNLYPTTLSTAYSNNEAGGASHLYPTTAVRMNNQLHVANVDSVIKLKNISNHPKKLVSKTFMSMSSLCVGRVPWPETLKFGITAQLLSVTGLEKAAIDAKPNHSMSRDFILMLIDEDNYSDIKLETEDGKVVNAHKFVLAARSPVLRAQIEKNVKTNTFNGVIMLDMESKTLEHILKWIYSGEFDAETGLDSILHAAAAYELTDLMIILDKKLIQSCTVENMFQLMMTAKRLNLSVAMKQIAQFIKENVDKIAA